MSIIVIFSVHDFNDSNSVFPLLLWATFVMLPLNWLYYFSVQSPRVYFLWALKLIVSSMFHLASPSCELQESSLNPLSSFSFCHGHPKIYFELIDTNILCLKTREPTRKPSNLEIDQIVQAPSHYQKEKVAETLAFINLIIPDSVGKGLGWTKAMMDRLIS